MPIAIETSRMFMMPFPSWSKLDVGNLESNDLHTETISVLFGRFCISMIMNFGVRSIHHGLSTSTPIVKTTGFNRLSFGGRFG